MNTITAPTDYERMAAAAGPGTYRTPDGALLRCRPLAGGAIIACEADAAFAVPEDPSRTALVKLSDEPAWPDDGARQIALLAFD